MTGRVGKQREGMRRRGGVQQAQLGLRKAKKKDCRGGAPGGGGHPLHGVGKGKTGTCPFGFGGGGGGGGGGGNRGFMRF